jgi:uncharacterized protein YhbP (UPF0306 family)
MQRDPRQLALDYLATHNVLTLATQSDGEVWAAAVFYANDDFELSFLSAGHTRHARNMAQTQRVAATIQEDYADWEAIKGIQLEGVVEKLEGVSRETMIANYLWKYPYVGSTPALRAAMQRVNWYRLIPTRLYFIDNSLGLGHRDLIVGSPE